MEHYKFTATAKHRGNLIRLAEYLMSGQLIASFDMRTTTEHMNPFQADSAVTCGAVGDVIGQGPHAGLWKGKNEGWLTYAERCFFPDFGRAGVWVCAAGWAETDNTPAGAARRIIYLLLHGTPGNFYEGTGTYTCNPELYAEIPQTWKEILNTYPQLFTRK